MATNVEDKYLAPIQQPIFQLDSSASWSKLTDKEKLYAHYLSDGSWYGSLICLHQTSQESPMLFSLFQKLFHANKIEDLKAQSLKAGVSEEEFNHLLQYAAAFYGNLGNYLSFGDTKFIPRISSEKFRKILESAQNKDEVLAQFDSVKARIYSSSPKELSLGLDEQGISTYYSDNITRKDVEKVRPFMQQKGISPYNTRLWKLDDNTYEIKKASAMHKETETHNFNGMTIKISYGDHAQYMQKLVENLQKALPYAANENQTKMIQKYIDSFNSGSIDDHKDSQRFWIKDIGPVVETNIGFIESYRDPEGERGEFEGFVAIVNKEMSAKFGKLVASAEQFITKLPWGKDFEKDKFLRPDFTSLEVVTFASSGVPSGINIPNYDDIRQTEGFKNVSLANVIAAKSNDPIEYILPSEHELYDKYETKAFEVQVGIHELLGHGTGKLLMVDANGKKNFSEDLINPLTNNKIDSWYKPGETWDSKFQSFASAMEECRAELCGLYLCTNKDLLSIFGYSGQEADDIFYINWLIMVRAGIRALEFYAPATEKWGQAHMRARYAILRTLVAAEGGLVDIKLEKDNVTVVLDRSKIMTVGMKAVGDFLRKLQFYKSTADVENGTKFFSELTQVPPIFLAVRDIVLAKKKPRRVFVQPYTCVENDQVKVETFPPTPEGLIASFVKRFPANV